MDILNQPETLTADRQLPPAAEALSALAIEHVDTEASLNATDTEALEAERAYLERIDAEALENHRKYMAMLLELVGTSRPLPSIPHHTEERPKTDSK